MDVVAFAAHDEDFLAAEGELEERTLVRHL